MTTNRFILSKYYVIDLIYFLLLITTFYSTRNLLTRLLMVAFVAIVFIFSVKENKFIKVPHFIFLFGLFILYGIINLITGHSVNADVSKTMIVSLFLNMVMVYFICQYIFLHEDKYVVLRITERAIVFLVIFVLLLSFRTLSTMRLGMGTDINSNILAIICSFGCMLNYLSYNKKIISSWNAIIKIALYITAIVLTGSRKGLIIIALFYFAILLFKYRKKVILLTFFIIILSVAMYFLLMRVEFFYSRIGYRFEAMIQFSKNSNDGNDYSLITRNRMIETGMEFFREKPWTGYGYDCYKTLPHRYYGLYSHNNYVELLVNGGIPAIVLYYIPFVWLICNLFKNRKKSPMSIYFVFFIIAKLAIEYAYVSYYSRVDAYLIAIILGCMQIAKGEEKNAFNFKIT